MMTERKRRSEEGRELDAQTQPTIAKKRHTAKDNDFQAMSAEFDEKAAMLDLDSIREFQKEAIWRQMQEYKRDAHRAQQRTSDLERRQAVWVRRIGEVCSLWDKAVRDLDVLINGAQPTDSQGSHSAQSSWLDILLPTKPPAHSGPSAAEPGHAELNESDSSASLDSADSTKSSLERFNASVRNVLRQLQAKSTAHDSIDWPSAVERLARIRTSESEIDSLKSRVAIYSRQITEEKELLEVREGELRRALKRLDRSICPTVRQTNADASRNSPGSQTSGPSSPSKNGSGDGAQQQPSVSTDGSTSVSVNGAIPVSQNPDDMSDYKLLAERRLAEIESVVQEKTQLISQLDSLKLQMAVVPDHIIVNTNLYKQAELQRNFYSTGAQTLQAKVDRLFAEVNELNASRTEFEESVQAEATAQRQALEAELQRLQGDLVRVRHHRDQIQRELEERRAQDAVEDQKSSELKLLSDVRRERMNALISENKRLLAYVSVLKGDRKAFETYTDDDLSRTTAVADELRAKLEQVVRREKQLSEQLDALSAASGGDEATAVPPNEGAQPAANEVGRLVTDLHQAKELVSKLNVRLGKYEEMLGGVCVDENGLIAADLPEQSQELAAKQKKLDELTLQRDSLQKTSEMMERELQTICESFAKLEEQNTRKVWDLSLKEQHISRVVAEKCKYEEKFIGLNKDREAQKQINQALRHQNAKQLEHIKSIEERDRALTQQLALASNETQQATSSWHATQAQLQEAQLKTAELEEKVKMLEEKSRVASLALDERTESLSKAEHEKKRAEEALELAKRRVSEAEKVTDQTGLAQMCADYKALLKCPTCQTHFKSHVLLRCMHVFCKECIDSRIETRQRKCPSCSEPFGAKDVRQIYL
ncbi:E3 ubiquitin-protein ligase bre1 [Dipsacomyces acuminosporus]|nr:E3 ubiquitin-protein ligase bre1 [Dipsacomyces acuminosporus]